MRREKTREELNQLFYPDLSRMTAGEKGELYGTEYLVCKQIIRDSLEVVAARCRAKKLRFDLDALLRDLFPEEAASMMQEKK